MGSFGDRLRREREMRGVSLDDIAAATKIGTRSLRALEDEQFEQLPGGIFNKGFVRAYAKFLGLNAEQAVADYLDAAGESSPDPHLIAEQNSLRIDRYTDTGGHRAVGFPVIPVVILLLFIAAGAGGWQLYQQRVRAREARDNAVAASSSGTTQSANPVPSSPQNTSAESPSQLSAEKPGTTASSSVQPQAVAAKAGSVGVDLNASAKAQTSATTPTAVLPVGAAQPSDMGTKPPTAAASPATTGQPFEVSVRAIDRAWVSLKSDGKITVRGIINPPDVKSVHATDQVVFWTGNAGAVEISFNGQRIALAGGPNQEGTLVFNSHGVVIPKPSAPNREP